MKRKFQLIANSDLFFYLFLALLFITTIYFFLITPIIATDSDMWYHLSGGKYFVENSSIAKNTYFSFISPSKNWFDYYWGFQTIIYEIFEYSGYYGLIIFRAILFFSLNYLILLILFNTKKSVPCLTLIFVPYFLFTIKRAMMVRPHMISYLLIVLFIYLLEYKRNKYFLLPILALFWMNSHGIEYPVMLLILFSYLAVYIKELFEKRTEFNLKKQRHIILLLIAMTCVFLTPHGLNLLKLPFQINQYLSEYINELIDFRMVDFLSFNFSLDHFSALTFFNVIFFFSFLSFISCLYNKKVNISHVLLFAAGVFLLAKGRRFMSEFVFLALPLIKANLPHVPSKNIAENKPVFWGSSISLISLSFLFVFGMFSNLPAKYPLATKKLPVGVSLFLKNIDVEGGSIMHHPNSGGYFRWELYPKYKIFMDMEIPPFSNEDFFNITNSLNNKHAFNRFFSRYHPSFISVPTSNHNFKNIIKDYPDFVPVFFDDAEVLYLNKRKFPRISDQYELKAFDPFTLTEMDFYSYQTSKIEAILTELKRTYEIYPEGEVVNQMIAELYNFIKQYNKALPHVDALIDNYGDLAKGYEIKADTLIGLTKYKEALLSMDIALDTSTEGNPVEIYKKMGIISLRLKDYDKAYKYLRKALGVFNQDIYYADLYTLASLANQNNKKSEALMLYKFAKIKAPLTNNSFIKQVDNEIQKIIFPNETK